MTVLGGNPYNINLDLPLLLGGGCEIHYISNIFPGINYFINRLVYWFPRPFRNWVVLDRFDKALKLGVFPTIGPSIPHKSISYGWEKSWDFISSFPISTGVKVTYDPPIDDWKKNWKSSDHHGYRIVIYWRSGGFQTSGGYVGLLSSFLQRIAWALVSSLCFRCGRILVHCSCVLFSPHLGDL